MTAAEVEAWRVQDSGLVAAPGLFRRLGGVVRHHQGEGAAWPDRVRLVVVDDALVVTSVDGAVGTWSTADVSLAVQGGGPPVTFVVRVPGAAHLLAAAADDRTAALLVALGD